MITYLTGDATQPIKKPALIMHVCNDIGGWGRGFVLALSKRWPEPERRYRAMQSWRLGHLQAFPVEDDIIVANMIAQHGISPDSNGVPPIRYDALATCLEALSDLSLRADRDVWPTIHCPRIGCGLAGGSWSVVEPLIEFYLKDREVYVYDLPEGR